MLSFKQAFSLYFLWRGLSSGGSFVFRFLPYGWKLHYFIISVSEVIDISLSNLTPACAPSSPAFHIMYSAYKLISKVTIYSLDVLLSQFGTSLLFHVQFQLCFLTCIQISKDTDKVVWCSHVLKNFPAFVVIHIVKGFDVINKAEVIFFFFWNSLAFLMIQLMLAIWCLGSLSFLNPCWLSGSAVHILLKPVMENFEYYFASVWDECSTFTASFF